MWGYSNCNSQYVWDSGMQAYMPTIAVGHNEIALAYVDRFATAIKKSCWYVGSQLPKACCSHKELGLRFIHDMKVLHAHHAAGPGG